MDWSSVLAMEWSPVTIVSIGIIGGLVLLVLLGVFALLKGFLRGIRTGPSHEYVAAPMDPNPPAAVATTPALRTVAWISLAWGLFNGALMVAWLVGGSALIDPAVQWLLSLYVLIASGATVGGALMLLAGRRYGRRGVAWGCMLMGVMSFCGCVMFVIFKYDPESQKAFRDVAIRTAVFLGIHVAVDMLLGIVAQRVGLGTSEQEEEESMMAGPLPEAPKAPLE